MQDATLPPPDTVETWMLRAWERGQGLDAPQRALLLAGEEAAERPVGAVHARLFARREALFGPAITALATCPDCGEPLELQADTRDFLAAPDPAPLHHAVIDGVAWQFRLPTQADLAALDPALDEPAAAAALLQRCIRQDGAAPSDTVAAALAARMEALDPLGDPELAAACHACGAGFAQGFDIGQFLWREIEARVARILTEIHTLARAYAWREADILAMPPIRRRAYLDLLGA